MFKKSLVLLLSVSFLLSVLPSTASAVFQQRTGKFSWYNGVGQIGSDGKILTDWDCAVKIGQLDTLPKGTKITAEDYLTQKQITVYKWDTGTMGGANSTIILDLSPTAFKALGHALDEGYITTGIIGYEAP